MTIYHWIFFAGFIIFLAASLYQTAQIFIFKKSQNYTKTRGEFGAAIWYSFTGAMAPWKKESANLHLPTYIAGIIFHLGTFLSFTLVAFYFFNINLSRWNRHILIAWLCISAVSGISILLKRILNKMAGISNPDDYFSNIFVTGFQFTSLLTLLNDSFIPILFIVAGILFLYIPFSKLKHVIYFFLSRIQLGIFLGSRGVWPAKIRKEENDNLF